MTATATDPAPEAVQTVHLAVTHAERELADAVLAARRAAAARKQAEEAWHAAGSAEYAADKLVEERAAAVDEARFALDVAIERAKGEAARERAEALALLDD